jgi:hypothetical protein
MDIFNKEFLSTKDSFCKLARDTEGNIKDLVQCIYEIYDNDYYRGWGYSSFAQFSRHCINVEPRTALWYVHVWHTVKECEYAGMGWWRIYLGQSCVFWLGLNLGR